MSKNQADTTATTTTTTDDLLKALAESQIQTNALLAKAVEAQMHQMQKASEPSWIGKQWSGVKKFHTDHTALAIAIDVAAVVGIVAIGTTVYNAYTADASSSDIDLQAADRLRAVG